MSLAVAEDTADLAPYLAALRAPLLTAAEERDLGHCLADGRAAQQQLALAPARALRAALQATAQAAQQAREQLIEANLRFVVLLARRYRNRGVPLIDLVQAGNLGLLRAVDKFDATKGVRFATYAGWDITRAMVLLLCRQQGALALPPDLYDLAQRMRYYQRQMLQVTGQEPGLATVAATVGAPLAIAQAIVRATQPALSLELPVGTAEEPCAFGVFLADPEANVEESVVARVAAGEQRRLLATWLTQLRPDERDVLVRRYGLQGEQPHALEHIATALGRSREAVRKVELRAVAKLTAYAHAPRMRSARPSA